MKPSQRIIQRIEEIESEFGWWDKFVSIFPWNYHLIVLQAVADVLDERENCFSKE